MTKAKAKTSEPDLDLEGRLSHKLGQAEGLASLINEATHAGHYDPTRMTNVCGLLEEVLEEVRAASDELVKRYRGTKPPAPGALPPLAQPKVKPRKVGRKARKQSAANGANGTQMPGEQPLNFGGGVQ